jgi:T-complex protein 1 subunit beta
VLRGATKEILDEAERSLHDALCVLTQTVKETRTVFGAGTIEREWMSFDVMSHS